MRLFILQWILLFSFQTALAETLEGRAASVHDGDTVTLLATGDKQLKIRLVTWTVDSISVYFLFTCIVAMLESCYLSSKKRTYEREH